jgi:superfamily II DNA or RNA helicase
VPCKPDPHALTDWLRAHQGDGLDVARRLTRGIFHHATGSGKTEIIIALTELYPCKWLVLVHKKDLLNQVAARFMLRTGEQIGIWGDGVRDISRRVTVAMFQSVHAALRGRDRVAIAFLSSVQGLSIDEVHVSPADTFWACIQACPNAYFRYGFSGTPLARGDQKSIYAIAAVGPIIHRVSAEDLWKIGWIAKPHITMTTVRHRPSAARTWDGVYKDCIIRSDQRNYEVVERVLQAKKPTLLFVKAIEHGKSLEKLIRARGQSVEFSWGEKATPMRAAAIERLVQGETDVLVCNVIFQEGVDIPALRSVGIASGGKSAIMVLQNTGRGTRRHAADGSVVKDEFEVYDFQDLGCGCNGIHPSCKWMEKHTRQRLAAYATENYPVFIRSSQRGGTANGKHDHTRGAVAHRARATK